MEDFRNFLNKQKNNDYSAIILKNSSQLPHEFNEIINEYKFVTGKNYVSIDSIMINILKKYDNMIGFYFKIVYINNNFLSYYNIIDYGSHEEIVINYDKYKLDLIKKCLSTENENENLISLIESIVFKNFSDVIKNEEEYSQLNSY